MGIYLRLYRFSSRYGKYLDVSYTKVGKEKVELDTSQLEIFIDAT